MSYPDDEENGAPQPPSPYAPRPRSTVAPGFPVVVPRSGLPVFAPVAAPRPPAEPERPVANAEDGKPPLTPTKRSHASAWVVVLVVLAVAFSALSAYLWVINSQWQEQNDQLRADVSDLGAQLEESNSQLLALQTDLADAQSSLDGATGKVTDLADSSANALDQAAFLSELADSFQQCSQAQATHISHLQNASRYTSSSLAQEGRDVAEYCDGVEATYEEFLANLESN